MSSAYNQCFIGRPAFNVRKLPVEPNINTILLWPILYLASPTDNKYSFTTVVQRHTCGGQSWTGDNLSICYTNHNEEKGAWQVRVVIELIRSCHKLSAEAHFLLHQPLVQLSTPRYGYLELCYQQYRDRCNPSTGRTAHSFEQMSLG